MSKTARKNKTFKKIERLYRKAFKLKGFSLALKPRGFPFSNFVQDYFNNHYKVIAKVDNVMILKRRKHTCSRLHIRKGGC